MQYWNIGSDFRTSQNFLPLLYYEIPGHWEYTEKKGCNTEPKVVFWIEKGSVFVSILGVILVRNTKLRKASHHNIRYVNLFFIGSAGILKIFPVICTEPKMVPRIETNLKPSFSVQNTFLSSVLHPFVLAHAHTRKRMIIILIDMKAVCHNIACGNKIGFYVAIVWFSPLTSLSWSSSSSSLFIGWRNEDVVDELRTFRKQKYCLFLFIIERSVYLVSITLIIFENVFSKHIPHQKRLFLRI